MEININDYIPLREAVKLYNKDASTLLRRIRETEGNKGESFIIGQHCHKIGGIWFLSKSRLIELYGEV